MKRAFIALGTNIEPREKHLTDALKSLAENKEIIIQKRSSIYETAPVGYTDQADFLNMVIEIKTSLTAIGLLDICQEIERNLGRKRTIRFGPRTIDLDILVYNQENSKTERLILPHPRMHERAFVLIPLQEIAPQLVVSTMEKRVVDLIDNLPDESVDDVRKLIVNKSSEES